jgi:hypothetical protein
LTFTALSLLTSVAACRSGSDTKRSPGAAGLVQTSLLNCTVSRLVMMRSHHGVNDPCGRQIAFEIARKSGTS